MLVDAQAEPSLSSSSSNQRPSLLTTRDSTAASDDFQQRLLLNATDAVINDLIKNAREKNESAGVRKRKASTSMTKTSKAAGSREVSAQKYRRKKRAITDSADTPAPSKDCTSSITSNHLISSSKNRSNVADAAALSAVVAANTANITASRFCKDLETTMVNVKEEDDNSSVFLSHPPSIHQTGDSSMMIGRWDATQRRLDSLDVAPSIPSTPTTPTSPLASPITSETFADAGLPFDEELVSLPVDNDDDDDHDSNQLNESDLDDEDDLGVDGEDVLNIDRKPRINSMDKAIESEEEEQLNEQSESNFRVESLDVEDVGNDDSNDDDNPDNDDDDDVGESANDAIPNSQSLSTSNIPSSSDLTSSSAFVPTARDHVAQEGRVFFYKSSVGKYPMATWKNYCYAFTQIKRRGDGAFHRVIYRCKHTDVCRGRIHVDLDRKCVVKSLPHNYDVNPPDFETFCK